MKKLFTLILIVTALNASAQKKDSAQLSDTTKFISLSDISRLSAQYQDKATFREYQSFLNIINQVLKEAVTEWNSKNKKK